MAREDVDGLDLTAIKLPTPNGLDAFVLALFNRMGLNSGHALKPTPVVLNGVQATYLSVQGTWKESPADVTVIAYAMSPQLFFYFRTIVPRGEGLGIFAPAVTSLQRIDRDQARSWAYPNEIEVTTVRLGDDVTSLASRTSFSDRKIERFLALNNLGRDANLSPGQKIKLVVKGAPSF